MKKTQQLFDIWNKEKKFLEFYKSKTKRVKVGEIWIAKIGVNIGSEVSKDRDFSRPVLVISNFLGGDLVGVIPFTTQYNQNYKNFYFELKSYKRYGLDKKSYLLLNQFKTISLKRLTRKINDKKVGGKNISLVPISFVNASKREIENKILQKKNP